MKQANKIIFFLIMVPFFLFSQSELKKSSLELKLDTAISVYNNGDFNKAISLFTACVQKAKEENNFKILSNAYNNLGNAYSQAGESKLALTNYQQSLKVAEMNGFKLRAAKTNNNIGAMYSDLGDFKSALVYYSNAQKIAKELNDTSLLANGYNNFGVIYEQDKKYDSALTVYNKALQLYTSTKDEVGLSQTLSNLGIVYKYLKDFTQSIKNYEASIAYSKKLNDQFLVGVNLNNLGNVYSLTGEYSKALNLFFEANQLSKKINAPQIVIETYDGIADAYYRMHDFTNAYKYRKLFEEEKNNYINAERTKQLAEMQTKYETEKKEKQIIELNEQKREQELLIQKRNFTIILIILFVLIIAFITFLIIKQNNLKQKQASEKRMLEKENEERTRIAKDIHDEIGSGLSKISLITELSKKQFADNKTIVHTIETIGVTAHQLIENMRDLVWTLKPENATIDQLVAHLREYVSDYLENFPIQLKINFPENIPTQIKISKEVQHHVLLTFKEAINNSLKHSQATEIVVFLNYNNNQLKLKITDNGKGFDKNLIAKKGNGLSNMQQRIVSIGGTFSIESTIGNGTSISFECLIV